MLPLTSATDQRPLAIFLMGPTASGKTALALRLAERFRVELISVDSALVYRGMDIGTAKPSKETLKNHPHCMRASPNSIPRPRNASGRATRSASSARSK